MSQATAERVAAIRIALNIDTTDLSSREMEQVWRASQQLAARTTCEWWAKLHGWKIPPYRTPEWDELQDAWLASDDEENERARERFSEDRQILHLTNGARA